LDILLNSDTVGDVGGAASGDPADTSDFVSRTGITFPGTGTGTTVVMVGRTCSVGSTVIA
jgi:hypothetical protein